MRRAREEQRIKDERQRYEDEKRKLEQERMRFGKSRYIYCLHTYVKFLQRKKCLSVIVLMLCLFNSSTMPSRGQKESEKFSK